MEEGIGMPVVSPNERYFVCMTTIPRRMECFLKAANSIGLQVTPFPFVFVIMIQPEFAAEQNPAFMRTILDTNPNLKGKYRLKYCSKSYGPGSKMIGLFEEPDLNEDAFIITVDDDIDYHPRVVHKLFSAAEKFPTEAISFSGWNAWELLCSGRLRMVYEEYNNNSLLDHVDILEGFKGICYRPKFFGNYTERRAKFIDGFFPPPTSTIEKESIFWCDDVWFSGNLAIRRVPRRIIRCYASQPSNPTMTAEYWRQLDIPAQETVLHWQPQFGIRNANAVAAFFNLDPHIWIMERVNTAHNWIDHKEWITQAVPLLHEPLRSIQKRYLLHKQITNLNSGEKLDVNVGEQLDLMDRYPFLPVDIDLCISFLENEKNSIPICLKLIEMQLDEPKAVDALLSNFVRLYSEQLKEGASPMSSVLPQQIFQIKLYNDPEKSHEETWKEKHSSWQYKMFQNEDILAFFSKFFPYHTHLCDEYSEFKIKSLVLPLLILFIHGGMYVQQDVECKRDFGVITGSLFKECRTKGLVVLSQSEVNQSPLPISDGQKKPGMKLCATTELMISTPGHPFWIYCLCHLNQVSKTPEPHLYNTSLQYFYECYQKMKQLCRQYPVLKMSMNLNS